MDAIGVSSAFPPALARIRRASGLGDRTYMPFMASSSSAAEQQQVDGRAPGAGFTGDSFIRLHLKKLSPYQPILPFEVLSTRLGRKPEDIIKLDANENPYGPPPEVAEALGTLRFPYIYPDPESRRLRAALAEDSGIGAEYILAGCGADELIDLIMRCVLDPGDKIVDCPPTFTMYEFDAAVNGALVIKDFRLDVPRIVEAVGHESPNCIFLTSPNNPDGSVINDEDLLKILSLPILVVLDEAYIEFFVMESRMDWVKRHENLIVLRTFSKRAVPRRSDFRLDVPRIVEAVGQESPKCIFLTSPNNPDGSVINDEDLLKILSLPILVVLDEAYIEFSGMESRMDWVKRHENLIVLRTFSKRAGLAGLRVGYGAFSLSIIQYLWRAKQPYNVSVAAEVSACAALQNQNYLERVKNSLVHERERLYNLLNEVPFLKPFPSCSNFILCEVTFGKDAKQLKEDLARMGVMIRHYSNKELRGYVRVSVGKPEHTDALMKCLKRLQ